MRDDRRELNKQLEMFLWGGLAVLGLHLYVELHSFFAGVGLSNPLSDNVLGKVASSNMFATPWTLKILGGLCIIGYGAANRGVKSLTIQPAHVARAIAIGLIFYVGSTFMLRGNSAWLVSRAGVNVVSIVYLVATIAGVLYLLKGTQGINRLLGFTPGEDEFNSENESFQQEEQLIENEYSVNLRTRYTYKGKLRNGWINIANPFRGNMILGIPGSGKSYAVVNSIIRQHMAKGFTMYVYDWKFPDLSLITYNAMLRHRKALPKNAQFYCINFDNPQKSHRCNPLDPIYLPNIEDAYESAKLMMQNMNKKWIGQEGDFWADSAFNYTTALIWFLRCYDKGQYCTFPHLVELMTIDYRKVFPILMAQPDLEAYMTLFVSAYNGGAMEQLEGQIGSARSGLAKLSSPNIYWTMSGNDFTLDINNKETPKILCIANNSRKKEIYGAALGLYNARVLNLINVPGQHPSSVIIDELPTIYFQGLGDLIATGRGNKIAVTIAMQDFSQLEKEYGKPEAEVIRNTTGTIISGAVSGQTAKAMEERLGKNVQQKRSLNIQSEDTTHGISTELQPMAPASKIGQLGTGQVVGVVAGNYGQDSKLKAFNAEVIIDGDDFKAEQKVKELPDFFTFAEGGPSITQIVTENYMRIKTEVRQLVDDELGRLGAEVATPPKRK